MSNEFSGMEGGVGSSPHSTSGELIPPAKRPAGVGDLKEQIVDDLSAARDTLKEDGGGRRRSSKRRGLEGDKFCSPSGGRYRYRA